ncbi:MAG: collagen binding domain-containing protein [Gemmatimonadales bacterium]
MQRNRMFAAAVAAVVAATPAVAQERPNVRGVVTAPSGAPIAGVEVRLEERAVTRTDEHGDFYFVNAPKGIQTLTFRRIGYLPAALAVKVPESSDTLTVVMVATPPTLDTVQVVAKLNVLAGIVIDAKNQPVPGAMVDVLGTKTAATTTDENGWFTFTSVKSGTVVVRARKPGYAMSTHSMMLEDWRGLVLHMDTLETKLGSAKRADISGIGNTVEFAWKETQQRIAMRGSRATIITREELAPYFDQPLGEAVRLSRAGTTLASDLHDYMNSMCVLQDGRTIIGSTTLDMFEARDVDFVELYPPGSEPSGTIARYMRGGGCRALRTPGQRSRGPFYAVVWIR